MTTLVEKTAWFAWASIARLRRAEESCPECGSREASTIDRKALVTELRRCAGCRLIYRVPPDSETFNRIFYNMFYAQGFTTDVPDERRLAALLDSGFEGTSKDYRSYIETLFALGARRGDHLFDFGASWGYGSWQLSRAGFDVVATEISARRRDFAREKLGVRMVDDPFEADFLQSARASFDVFFSSHVLEHVPRPSRVWELGRALLRPGGLFVAITPNGSEAARKANPNWRKLWGLVHPNLLDDEFYLTRFQAGNRLVGSLPLNEQSVAAWVNAGGDRCLPLSGSELLFAARL